MYGKKYTEETKMKMRKPRINTKNMAKSEETKKKIGDWHRGKEIPKEMRERISKTLTGRKRTKEEIEKFKNSIQNSEKAKNAWKNSDRNKNKHK